MYSFHQEGNRSFEEFVLQYMRGDYNAPLFAGLQSLHQKDAAAAIENLQAAIRLSPHAAECHAALAEAFWLTGKFPAALGSAKQAAGLDAQSQKYPQLIARIQASRGQFKAARHAMQAATALGAEPGPGYRDISAIAAERGHNDEALALIEAAGQADPLDPDTQRVARQLRAASDDVSGAEKAVHRSLAHVRAGQIKPAVAAARRSVALAPHAALCWALLGDLLMRTGACDEGEVAFRSAIALEPDDPGFGEQLNGWLRRAGKIDSANADASNQA